MNQNVKIQVSNLISSPLCISAEDGQKLFVKISDLLEKDKNIIISFENSDMIISLFLNVAIGQLYSKFKEEDIKGKITVEGLSPDDMELLKRVVENAKRYYSNPDSYDKIWRDDYE